MAQGCYRNRPLSWEITKPCQVWKHFTTSMAKTSFRRPSSVMFPLPRGFRKAMAVATVVVSVQTCRRSVGFPEQPWPWTSIGSRDRRSAERTEWHLESHLDVQWRLRKVTMSCQEGWVRITTPGKSFIDLSKKSSISSDPIKRFTSTTWGACSQSLT